MRLLFWNSSGPAPDPGGGSPGRRRLGHFFSVVRSLILGRISIKNP